MSLFSTGVRPAVDSWLVARSQEERDYGEYWSASSGGYCMRKVIFERLGVPHVEKESDARKQRVFTSGHLFHDWIQGITKESGLSIAQELELQDEELMIRGHIDDLVLINVHPASDPPDEAPSWAEPYDGENKLILYDYKTVNSRAFLWAKKNGNAMSFYHRLQLGTYMYMLRANRIIYNDKTWNKNAHDQKLDMKLVWNLTEARILKIEKDTLMMNEQQLLWSDELEKEVVGYWTTLNKFWAEKKLPKCTCADYEGGFMAKENYNPYFYDGQPCSIKYYKSWKKGQEAKS